MTKAKSPGDMDAVFKALSAAPRRQILSMLASGAGAGDDRCCGPYDVCACRFAEELGITASTVSHHMRVLVDAGLVTSEKRGLWVFYRLRQDTVASLFDALTPLRDADLGPPCDGAGIEQPRVVDECCGTTTAKGKGRGK